MHERAGADQRLRGLAEAAGVALAVGLGERAEPALHEPRRAASSSGGADDGQPPRRAGARAGAMHRRSAAPALAAALPANTNGSSRRASCQTGHGGVGEQRRRVGRERAGRARPRRPGAGAPARQPPEQLAVPAAAAGACRDRRATHEPTLIGEVTLKTRSMLRKRSGRPRSVISSTGLTPTPASATQPRAVRASVGCRSAGARQPRRGRAPASAADEEVPAGSPASRPAP